MAQNKKNIKNVKISTPLWDKLERENQRRDKFEKMFKMPKSMKRKIYALLGAATVTFGAFQTSQAIHYENTHNDQPEKMATIALPNEGAQIREDGKIYTVDENSFIIISDDQALAYDKDGNIHNGFIPSTNYTKVKEI